MSHTMQHFGRIVVGLISTGFAGFAAIAEPPTSRPASRGMKQGFQRLVGDRQAAGRIAVAAPDCHDLTAYIDCGWTSEQLPGGPAVQRLNGHPWSWPAAQEHGPLGTVMFDADEVVYEISGLKPDGECVLGFSWWDYDQNGRRQSVRFGTGEPVQWTTVLPATEALAYHEDKPTWSQIQLPITRPYTASGRLLVGFHRDRGTNAVVNELWLLQKQASTPAGPCQTQRRVLIVTGDDYPGHRWRQTAPELAVILRADPRLEVTVVESPAVLGSPLLAHYDAVVMHYMNWKGHPDPGEAVRKGLEQYVESGKGLVFVHFACGAFEGWSDYVKLAGRVYDPALRGHDPYGEFEVRVADRSHPITQALADFKAIDELYTCLAGETPVRVLAEATSVVDKKAYPIGFVLESRKGRVFHSPLGHDVKALKSPGTRELFHRATAWAAGLPQMD